MLIANKTVHAHRLLASRASRASIKFAAVSPSLYIPLTGLSVVSFCVGSLSSLHFVYGLIGLTMLLQMGLTHPAQLSGYCVECSSPDCRCVLTMSAMASKNRGSSLREGDL